MRAATVSLVLLFSACGSGLPHDSQFDPDAPASKQAPASLVAKLSLRGEGDFADISLQLQGADHTYAADSQSDGAVRVAGIVPGDYALIISTRYFEPVRQSVTLALGEELDLGAVELLPKTAQVAGRALLERLDANHKLVREGGVNLTLRRIGSIRGAGSAEPVTGTSYATVSTSDGAYAFANVPAGIYAAVASASGVGDQSLGELKVTGEEVGAVLLADALLRPLAGFFEIEGVADGAPSSRFTQSSAVTLKLSGFGASKMRVGRSASGQAQGCVLQAAAAIAAVTTVDLPAEGVNVVCVTFLDDDGNETAPVMRSIVFDRTAPTAAAVQIAAGAAYAPSLQLSLALSAADTTAGVDRMIVADNAAFAGAAVQPYVPALVYPLSSTADGVKTVYVKYLDAAGNWSAPVSDTIVYDTQPPQVAGAGIMVEGGAAFARQTMVALGLDAAGATQMKLANDGNFGASPWEPFRAATSWFLPDIQGNHSVGVYFRDDAGNTSGPFSAAIELDSLPPTSPAVAIDGGAQYAVTTAVGLTLGALGATQMQVSNDGVFDAEPVQSLASPIAWTLDAGQGIRSVYARFFDDAGNVSQVAASLVLLDSLPPDDGSLKINGGAAYTNGSTVSLAVSSAGAETMRIAEGACPATGPFIPFSGSQSFDLGSVEGLRTLYARFRDPAGNLSLQCASASIMLDLGYTDAPAAEIQGPENIAGRTRSALVAVKLNGLAADSYEMQIANDAGLTGAAWSPVTTATTWLLAAGDGVKTVYLRVRDRAGNVSPILSPQINLVQTGPEVPGLVLADAGTDGFALSSGAVEMGWSAPSSPFLAGYEIQRYVAGYDPSFAPLVSLSVGTNSYVDAIAATVGYVHHYRVRAFDDLGNVSDWSLALSATPFEPVAGAFWIHDVTGDRYFFPPSRGVFSLRPTYGFDDVAGAAQSVGLTQDVSTWTRTIPASFQVNERLNIRTANQDNGLVYASAVDLGFDSREQKDFFGVGNYNLPVAPAFVDGAGVFHMCYKYQGYSSVQCRAKGAAGWTSEGYAPDVNNDYIDMAAGGGVYHFAGGVGYSNISYFTKSASGWSVLETVETGDFNRPSIAVDRQGRAHLAYVDNAAGMLHYAHNVTGPWNITVVGPAAIFTDIAVDGAGFAHIVAYNGGPVYFTNTSGVWQSTLLDAGGPYFSIAVDDQDSVYIAYNNLTQTAMQSDETGGWVTTVLADVIATPNLAINFEGEPEVAYFGTGAAAGLHVLRRSGAAWSDTVVENSGKAISGYQLTEAADGKAYVSYVTSLGEFNVVSLRQGPVLRNVTAGGMADMRIDASGGVHAVYADAVSVAIFALVNTDGTWRRSFIDGQPARQPVYPSVATDAAGRTHVSYYDQLAKTLWYATNVNGAFTTTQVDGAGDQGQQSSLVIDAAGAAHIAYLEVTGLYFETVLRYADNVTGAWHRETVALPDPLMTYAHAPVLAYDRSHNLHLFAGVEINDGTIRRLVHGIRLGNGWLFETLPAAAYLLGGDVKAVAFDTANAAHVLTGNMSSQTLYATNAGGVWSRTLLETVDGQSGGIAVDARGFVHVVYDDSNSSRVRFATNAMGSWYFTTLDATSQPLASSFAIDAAGRSHAMFTRYGLSQVMYVGDFAGWKPARSITRVTPFQ